MSQCGVSVPYGDPPVTKNGFERKVAEGGETPPVQMTRHVHLQDGLSQNCATCSAFM